MLDGVSVAYTKSGNTISRTDPAGRTRTVVSDPGLGRPTSDTLSGAGASSTTAFTYDAGGRLKTVTRPEGDRSEYDYDARGNQVAQRLVAKPTNPIGTLESTAGFDGSCSNALTCNQPVWTRDAMGRQTDYIYDPNHGGVTLVRQPAPIPGGVRPEARIGYAAQGDVTLPISISACRTTASCAGSADERVTQIGYDSNLNIVSTARRAGDSSVVATSSFAYDAVGNRISTDGPLAGTADTTRYRYDASRRLVGVVGPDPDGGGARRHGATRTIYDAAGHTISQEVGSVASQSDSDWSAFSPARQSTTSYDVNGRADVQRLVAGTTVYSLTQMSYDGLGRSDCVTQRLNPAIYGDLPGACSLGAPGAFGPDRIGRTYYDALGRAYRHESGIGTAEAADDGVLAFTGNGRIASATDGKGNKTSYGYDGFDRLIRTFYPSQTTAGQSNTGDWEGFAYYPDGRVSDHRLRDGQVYLNTVDALGRVTLVRRYRQGAGIFDQTSYAYDNRGALTQATQSSTNQTVTLGYDALGRLVSDGQAAGAMLSGYDVAGRRTRLTWPDGQYVTYDYDTTGAMTKVRDNGAAELATYTYDDLGRRTEITRGNGAKTKYEYDTAGRLDTLTQDIAGTGFDDVRTFTYNPAGQIASRSGANDAYAYGGLITVDRPYAVNGLNQYTTAGPASFEHDARGNLTRSQTPQANVTYTYDIDNRMTAAAGVALGYDPLGRMNRIVEGGYTRNILRDVDGAMVGWTMGAGANTRFVPGAGVDEPLVWFYPGYANAPLYFHGDERGSVVALSNRDGSGHGINRYDEYGNPNAADGGGMYGPFGFTGQMFLSGIGLYDYKARMYSPTLGRFMQTDPIGYGDGLNWYNYVGGDPINRTDPSGRVAQSGSSNGGLCAGQDAAISDASESIVYAPSGGNIGFGYSTIVRGWWENQLNPRNDFVVGGETGAVGELPPEIVVEATPQRERPQTLCQRALNRPGRIETGSIDAAGILGIGLTGSAGWFRNVRTGDTGYFWSAGVGAGVDLGASLNVGVFSSLRAFVGYAETAGVSLPNVGGFASPGGSVSKDLDGNVIGGAGAASAGPSSLRAGASGTLTNTTIYGCSLGSGR